MNECESYPASVWFTPQQSVRKVKKNLQVNTSRQSAFTLVEIMIVVAIIGLLAAIAIPNLIKARESSQKNGCISNLKQIEGAKQTWAIENKKVSTDTPLSDDLYGTTVYIRDEPTCPANGSYTIGSVATRATCVGTVGHTL